MNSTLRIVAVLAWRNLWRNHRRTLIMIAAVTVGAWAMIFMTALMRGMVNDMMMDGVRNLPGHVQAHHPAFRDDPSVNNLIPIPDDELARRLDGAPVVAPQVAPGEDGDDAQCGHAARIAWTGCSQCSRSAG